MKGRRYLLWRWCPDPERMKVTRTRPADRSFVPLAASAVVLLILAFQGIQPWAPSAAVNSMSPNSYAPFPPVQPALEAPAQTTTASQITSTVSTEHLTVQLSFPESADPGQSVTVSATTTAKSNGKVVGLTIEVYSYADKQLVKVASETVVKDKRVRSGDTWQTSLTAVIPANAQRAAMVGTVTEVWEETSYYYSSRYYRPYYDYYYPYYRYDFPYPYDYSMYYYVYEPSYTVTQKSSAQTVPLTYVLATTPEYEELLKKHEQLSQEYDQLVAKHNELSSKYDSLRADYDQTVSKYNQLQSDYNSATLELGNYRLYTYVLIVVAVVLSIVSLFLVLQRRQPAEPPRKREQVPQPPEKRKE